jgi:Uma2 family endonuclease
MKITDGWIDVAPDLAVDVSSPYDTTYRLEERLRPFVSPGLCEVWSISPWSRSMLVFRPQHAVESLAEHQTFVGAGALEGFSCCVGDFFPKLTPAVRQRPNDSYC